MAATNQPANQTFVLFHRLPAELRLLIYSYALPSPRLVEIGSIKEGEQYVEGTEDNEVRFAAEEKRPKDYGPFPYPGLLAVSHEAREFCLKNYQKVNNFPCTIYTPRYFDFGRDMFVFQQHNFTSDYGLVQNLFVNNAPDADLEDSLWCGDTDTWEETIRCYPNLRVIYYAIRQDCYRGTMIMNGAGSVLETKFPWEKWTALWKNGQLHERKVEEWKNTPFVVRRRLNRT